MKSVLAAVVLIPALAHASGPKDVATATDDDGYYEEVAPPGMTPVIVQPSEIDPVAGRI